jgi:phospholipid N-methyltransferase
MNFSGSVDVFRETEISGWAADLANQNRQVFVEILVNSTPVASIRGCLFRPDLIAAGIGDGRKGFHFDPRPYLTPGKNAVEVRYAGTTVGLPGGKGPLNGIYQGVPCDMDQTELQQLLALSQERWRGDEADPHLTWGRIFSGDSFVDALLKHYQFSPDHYICEIGPGYGRLLKTILERRLPFKKYTGVELSEDRVRKLSARFGSECIEFVAADVATVRLSRVCDLVFSSSTFEHLFPDCSMALKNLVDHNLGDRGQLAIDFIQFDEAMHHEDQAFEPHSRAFVRTYSCRELERFYLDRGLSSIKFDSIVLGQASFGPVRRIFSFAYRSSA